MTPDNQNIRVLLKDIGLDKAGLTDKQKWERELFNEMEGIPSDVGPAAREYLETVIQAVGDGKINPVQYGNIIVEENARYAPTWRFLSETIHRVHDAMVERSDPAILKLRKNFNSLFLK